MICMSDYQLFIISSFHSHIIFIPCSYLKDLLVLLFTLKYTTQLKLVWVHGLRKQQRFFFFHLDIQWSQHHLLKRLPFSHHSVYHFCHKPSIHLCLDLFVCFLFSLIGLSSYQYHIVLIT